MSVVLNFIICGLVIFFLTGKLLIACRKGEWLEVTAFFSVIFTVINLTHQVVS